MALIILAGGNSSRMGGRDKAFLELGDRNMIGHIIHQLNNVFEELIVVGKDKQLYQAFGVKFVHDVYPGCGPISGVHAGLSASCDRYNLILGCDQPLIKSGLARYLWERARCRESLITIPEIGGRLEPLLGVYDRKLTWQFEKAISEGNYKLQKVLRSIELDIVYEAEVRELDPDLLSFMNVNTAVDLRRVDSILSETKDKE